MTTGFFMGFTSYSMKKPVDTLCRGIETYFKGDVGKFSTSVRFLGLQNLRFHKVDSGLDGPFLNLQCLQTLLNSPVCSFVACKGS